MRWLPALSLVVLLAGCHMSEAAASRDPMKCERDPKCNAKRGRTADCSLQCSDDPACVDRCEAIQQTTNTRLGH